MDELDAAEGRVPSSGSQLDAVLQAFQQRRSRKESANLPETVGDGIEENRSKGLLSSPKKKLVERWEQVSPSVKQTLQRYTPRRIKGWFDDQTADENAVAMDISSSKHIPAQMVAERKSRYKQIAEFCLNDSTPPHALSQPFQLSSQTQSYLTPLSTSSPTHTSAEPALSVPYLTPNRLNTEADAAQRICVNEEVQNIPIASTVVINYETSIRNTCTQEKPQSRITFKDIRKENVKDNSLVVKESLQKVQLEKDNTGESLESSDRISHSIDPSTPELIERSSSLSLCGHIHQGTVCECRKNVASYKAANGKGTHSVENFAQTRKTVITDQEKDCDRPDKTLMETQNKEDCGSEETLRSGLNTNEELVKTVPELMTEEAVLDIETKKGTERQVSFVDSGDTSKTQPETILETDFPLYKIQCPEIEESEKISDDANPAVIDSENILLGSSDCSASKKECDIPQESESTDLDNKGISTTEPTLETGRNISLNDNTVSINKPKEVTPETKRKTILRQKESFSELIIEEKTAILTPYLTAEDAEVEENLKIAPLINLPTDNLPEHPEGVSEEHSIAEDVVGKVVEMPVRPPHIVLSSGSPHRPRTLHPPAPDPDVALKRKSPVTVQEWVDHLPVKPTPPPEIRTEEPLIESAALLRCQAASKLSREPSVQSSSSLDSLLDSRRPDPVEVLLNLGFGGVPGIDLDNCRIPKRFLVPSKCKGGDWDEFLRRELIQIQNFECTSLGFRGLSGSNHQRPSAIVANIMEKLRERSSPRPPPPRVTSRFTAVAKRVLSETSVLSKLTTQSSSTSVLTPDNRKFLESQGKISPEVPRRRIIFGEKSFAINKDGELVEEEARPAKTPDTSAAGSWSLGSGISNDPDSDSEDGKSELTPSSADLYRMRRSSLQRQHRIEDRDDEELDEGPAVPHRFDAVSEAGEDLRGALAAEIETLSRRIQSANPEELAAILTPIKELRGKLADL